MATFDSLYSSFLKADDFKADPRVLTIKHTEVEEVGQKKDKKLVLYFEEDPRGLVLNKTNYGIMGDLFGSQEIDKWTDGKIEAFFDPSVKFQGKRVGGIGIRAPK